MLEIQNLTAGYPGHPVLDRVSLTLPQGKITVIVGPNGCGKSTLLKSLAGILKPEGDIRLDGQSLTSLSSQELAQKIAYLPQNRQIPDITVERLVLHGRFPYLNYPRRYRKEDYAIARAAMERMGIGDLAQRSLPTLSGGQRQKVYIAMALAQDTPVVLLDEPTTFLDISHQMQLMTQAMALAKAGKTVVLVLHDLTMAMEYADSLVVMEDGRVVCRGDAETMFASGKLAQVFGIQVKRMHTPDGWKYYYGAQRE